MALHWLSDAINAGSNGPCPAADQRGVLRDGSCDIGAFERVDMADIQISAVINQAPPYYEGQPLTFDVNVTNDGPNVANGIQIDLSFDNLAVQTIDGICETNPCTIESLLPGAGFETITVSAQPINLAAVDFELTASASNAPMSIYQEIDSSNNSSSAMGTLGSAADLAIEKTLLSPPPYSMGQAIEYEIVVENLGPDLASDVVVVDSPEGITINNISNCSNPPAGPCGFTGLADGNQLSLMVSATISSERFNNQVLVVSSSFDPNPANDIDERGNGGNTESDSDLKTSVVNATSGPYYNGKVLNYTVGVTNLGPDTATDVEIDLQFANSFPLGISGDCNVIPCIVPLIAEGADATVSLQLSVGNSLDNGGLIAVVSSNQTDADLTNNIDGDSYSVIEASDVGVTLTPVSSPPYFQGLPVQYELRVFNLGFDYADDVVVDLIRQNLTVQSALSDSCVSLPCTIPTLGLAQTEVMEIIVLPDNIGPFSLSTSAEALQYDPIPANNLDNTNNNGVADIDPSMLIFRDSLESP